MRAGKPGHLGAAQPEAPNDARHPAALAGALFCAVLPALPGGSHAAARYALCESALLSGMVGEDDGAGGRLALR